MISVTDLRNGTKVLMEGQLWECLEYSHIKMGRGGAKIVCKFRNLETGATVEKTFNNSEKVEDIFIDYKKMQYLYNDGTTYTFMDMDTYEQPTLSSEQVGDAAKWLKESMEVQIDYYQGRALKLTLPNHVELEVTYTEPGVKGDTSSGGTKPATVETGATIQVPLFVDQGTIVKIDTRTGDYLGRV